MNVDDINVEIAHNQSLIREYKRRLRPLEIQKAKYGKDCPPQIINEIEDVTNEIYILEQRLNQLQSKMLTSTKSEEQVIYPLVNHDYPNLKVQGERVIQNEKSSALLQKYYQSLATHKIRVIAFTILSFFLFAFSVSGYSVGKHGFRYDVLALLLFSTTLIGSGMVCILYARKGLQRFLMIICALLFGTIGLITLSASLQRFISLLTPYLPD